MKFYQKTLFMLSALAFIAASCQKKNCSNELKDFENAQSDTKKVEAEFNTAAKECFDYGYQMGLQREDLRQMLQAAINGMQPVTKIDSVNTYVEAGTNIIWFLNAIGMVVPPVVTNMVNAGENGQRIFPNIAINSQKEQDFKKVWEDCENSK